VDGSGLTAAEQRTVAAYAERPETVAAIRFAELVAGDVWPSNLRPAFASLRSVARGAAGARRQKLEGAAVRLRDAPDHLPAMVLQQLTRKQFDEQLRAVLRRRGLRADALMVPVTDVWAWLESFEAGRATGAALIPDRVHRLRALDDDAFRAVVEADATGVAPEPHLSHPAVAERWRTCVGGVTVLLRRALHEAGRAPAGGPAVAAAAVAHARAVATGVLATAAVDALRLRALRFHHQEVAQHLRASCFDEVHLTLLEDAPRLARIIADACAAHRRTCPRAGAPVRCRRCAEQVAATVDASGHVPLPPRTPSVPADAPSEPPAPPAADAFACAATFEQLPGDRAHVTAAVAVRTAPGSRLFGFAWVTAEGELRTGTDLADDAHDAAVRAICEAAHDLGADGTAVHVTCRDAAAAGAVRETLAGGAAAGGAPSLSAPTRARLRDLRARGGPVTVYADACAEPHRGAVAADRLAGLALAGGRGTDGGRRMRAEADRTAQELARDAGPRLTAPTEHDDQAWLVGREHRDTLGHPVVSWQTAVRQAHLDGGWCPLPGGLPVPVAAGLRLRLRIDHQVGGEPPARHDVTVRRRDGGLVLHGVRWPGGLLPGVLVTLKWRTDTGNVTAQTAGLPRPERVDGVLYHHRYEPRVATRDCAPGADQRRDVPVLTQTGWVLRTLRTLGYLAADGSAALAQDALVRDCERLGMPRSLLPRVAPAVDELVRTGLVRRVEGGVDAHGRPWLPHRPGQLRTTLLRYVPRIEAASGAPPAAGGDGHDWHHRPHVVAGFVRRLQPGAHASAEQVELHQQAVRAFEVVERTLPEGYTYVRRHRRGG
jgi:hypothetical protein